MNGYAAPVCGDKTRDKIRVEVLVLIIIETISGVLAITCDMTVGGMVMLPKRLKQ